MSSASEIIENIKDFLSEGEKKKKTAIIAVILIFMTVSAVVIASFRDLTSKKKESEPVQKLMILDQKLLVPEGEYISSDYIVSRKTPEKWGKEDVEKWFMVPDEKELEKLRDSNHKMTEDILGAAQ